MRDGFDNAVEITVFSKDASHYRMAPRTLQTSKFGAYARLSVPKRTWVQEAAEYVGYAVAGIVFGGVISSVMYGAYKALGWAVTQ